jgi:hypothetical protein
LGNRNQIFKIQLINGYDLIAPHRNDARSIGTECYLIDCTSVAIESKRLRNLFAWF